MFIFSIYVYWMKKKKRKKNELTENNRAFVRKQQSGVKQVKLRVPLVTKDI